MWTWAEQENEEVEGEEEDVLEDSDDEWIPGMLKN